MKLIIKEYLSLLKESDELDRLIPDLLLMMGLEPISHPQKGVRQYGVDVAAVGKIDGSQKALFLFTVKRGDLGRVDWDSGEQSIRQSLNDIKDVYLQQHVQSKHKSLKKVIILCTGGILKQEIEPNWKGFIQNEEVKGEREYDFWGGDTLALYIENYMLNENIFPLEYKSAYRKALALLTDPDYDLSDYYNILSKTLFDTHFGDMTKPSNLKKVRKTLKTINLALNIVFQWAKSSNNLKPAVFASERTLLLTWEFLRKNCLLSFKEEYNIFLQIFNTTIMIYSQYFEKLQTHYYYKNGLHGYSNHAITENLNVFEQLGILSTIGIIYSFLAESENSTNAEKCSHIILDSVKEQIVNHLSLHAPSYDSHIIEISETIFLLAQYSEFEFIDNWIRSIINHICFSYKYIGKYFPIYSDSFDDLVALNISGSINKEELMKISTLIPILAQWCVVLDLKENYEMISKINKKIFTKTTMQIWYPGKDIDEFLYVCNAGFKSGYSVAPIQIPESIEEMRQMIEKTQESFATMEDISALKYGLPILPFIASRHYRTPILPIFWQQIQLQKRD